MKGKYASKEQKQEEAMTDYPVSILDFDREAIKRLKQPLYCIHHKSQKCAPSYTDEECHKCIEEDLKK